eukprot:gene13236-9082_t
MAVTTKGSFKEYYNALVARKPTDAERINEMIRSELAFRKIIEKEQWKAFQDVLHVGGLMIADKKRMEKGDVPLGLTPSQVEDWFKSRRVWFPKLVPRQVPPRSRPGPVGYPYKASKEIQDEEPEIRKWIVGVEAKLRESILKHREDSLTVIKELELIRTFEERGRNRIRQEENDEFAVIRKQLFLSAPPDYFRQKVIERYGATQVIEPRELTLEEREEVARVKLIQAEEDDFKKTWGYLNFVHGAYLFMLNHEEIVGRHNIEEEWNNRLYEVIAQSCRQTSGLTYYYTPAVALHCTNAAPSLRELAESVIIQRAQLERPKVYSGRRMVAYLFDERLAAPLLAIIRYVERTAGATGTTASLLENSDGAAKIYLHHEPMERFSHGLSDPQRSTQVLALAAGEIGKALLTGAPNRSRSSRRRMYITHILSSGVRHEGASAEERNERMNGCTPPHPTPPHPTPLRGIAGGSDTLGGGGRTRLTVLLRLCSTCCGPPQQGYWTVAATPACPHSSTLNGVKLGDSGLHHPHSTPSSFRSVLVYSAFVSLLKPAPAPAPDSTILLPLFSGEYGKLEWQRLIMLEKESLFVYLLCYLFVFFVFVSSYFSSSLVACHRGQRVAEVEEQCGFAGAARWCFTPDAEGCGSAGVGRPDVRGMRESPTLYSFGTFICTRTCVALFCFLSLYLSLSHEKSLHDHFKDLEKSSCTVPSARRAAMRGRVVMDQLLTGERGTNVFTRSRALQNSEVTDPLSSSSFSLRCFFFLTDWHSLEVMEVDPPALLGPEGDASAGVPAVQLRLERRRAVCHCEAAPQPFVIRSSPAEDRVRLHYVRRTSDGEVIDVAASPHAMRIGTAFRRVGACWIPLLLRSGIQQAGVLLGRVRLVWEVRPEDGSAFFHVPHDYLVPSARGLRGSGGGVTELGEGVAADSVLGSFPPTPSSSTGSSDVFEGGRGRRLTGSTAATDAFAADGSGNEEAENLLEGGGGDDDGAVLHASDDTEGVAGAAEDPNSDDEPGSLRRLLYFIESTTSLDTGSLSAEGIAIEDRYANLYATPCPALAATQFPAPLLDHPPSSALEYYRMIAARNDAAAERKDVVDLPLRKSALYAALKEGIMAKARERYCFISGDVDEMDNLWDEHFFHKEVVMVLTQNFRLRINIGRLIVTLCSSIKVHLRSTPHHCHGFPSFFFLWFAFYYYLLLLLFLIVFNNNKKKKTGKEDRRRIQELKNALNKFRCSSTPFFAMQSASIRRLLGVSCRVGVWRQLRGPLGGPLPATMLRSISHRTAGLWGKGAGAADPPPPTRKRQQKKKASPAAAAHPAPSVDAAALHDRPQGKGVPASDTAIPSFIASVDASPSGSLEDSKAVAHRSAVEAWLRGTGEETPSGEFRAASAALLHRVEALLVSLHPTPESPAVAERAAFPTYLQQAMRATEQPEGFSRLGFPVGDLPQLYLTALMSSVVLRAVRQVTAPRHHREKQQERAAASASADSFGSLALCLKACSHLVTLALKEAGATPLSPTARQWINVIRLPFLSMLAWEAKALSEAPLDIEAAKSVAESCRSALRCLQKAEQGSWTPKEKAEVAAVSGPVLGARLQASVLSSRLLSQCGPHTTAGEAQLAWRSALVSQMSHLALRLTEVLQERSSSPGVDPHPMLVGASRALERLAAQLSPPPPRVQHIERQRMCHCTAHSQLNIQLAELWEARRRRHLHPKVPPPPPSYVLQEPAAAQQLLHSLTSLLRAAQLPGAIVFPQSVSAAAVLTRVALDLELSTSMQVYAALGFSNKTSVDAMNAFSQGGSAPRPQRETTAQTALQEVLLECLLLRAEVCRLVSHVFVCPSTSAAPEGGALPLPLVRDQYLFKFQNNFNSLLRRHYIFHSQEARVLTGGTPERRSLAEAAFQAVCRDWLAVFLHLRTISPALGQQKEHEWRQCRSYFSACGTSLTQAMEVCFFLTTAAARWPDVLAVGGATPSAVEQYLQEVFLVLEHSTAKQLWHLRSTNALFFFTGETKGHVYTTDPALRRRHAQSVLSVVHSHVRHPSLLWMPLWQVQELLCAVARCPTALFASKLTPRGTSRKPASAKPSEAGEGAGAGAGGEEGRSPSPQPHSTLLRVTAVVGQQQSDFSLLHGYFVSRLFVLSNVLRRWRQHVADSLEPGAPGATHPDREALMQELQRLQRLEPAAELEKHTRRLWSLETVQDLVEDMTLASIPAQVEGTRDLSWGALRAVRRLESTVRTALEHHLVRNVAVERAAARDPGAPAPTSTIPTPVSSTSPVVVVAVRRHATTQPLGFTLRGADAALLQVGTLDGVEAPAPPQPFAAAATAAGLRPDQLIGWRVAQVDGHAVSTAAEVAQAIKGKHIFTLQLVEEKLLSSYAQQLLIQIRTLFHLRVVLHPRDSIGVKSLSAAFALIALIGAVHLIFLSLLLLVFSLSLFVLLRHGCLTLGVMKGEELFRIANTFPYFIIIIIIIIICFYLFLFCYSYYYPNYMTSPRRFVSPSSGAVHPSVKSGHDDRFSWMSDTEANTAATAHPLTSDTRSPCDSSGPEENENENEVEVREVPHSIVSYTAATPGSRRPPMPIGFSDKEDGAEPANLAIHSASISHPVVSHSPQQRQTSPTPAPGLGHSPGKVRHGTSANLHPHSYVDAAADAFRFTLAPHSVRSPSQGSTAQNSPVYLQPPLFPPHRGAKGVGQPPMMRARLSTTSTLNASLSGASGGSEEFTPSRAMAHQSPIAGRVVVPHGSRLQQPLHNGGYEVGRTAESMHYYASAGDARGLPLDSFANDSEGQLHGAGFYDTAGAGGDGSPVPLSQCLGSDVYAGAGAGAYADAGMAGYAYEGGNPLYQASISSSMYTCSPTGTAEEGQELLYNLHTGDGSCVLFAPEEVRIITCSAELDSLCSMLLYECNKVDSTTTIALDLEGRDLGRNGTLCIITLATTDCIYLIDMVELGAAVLESPRSLLRTVLESHKILKLMFDCRGDCEALYYPYHVRLANVCDLQVASCCALCSSARHLPSMKTVLTRLKLLEESEKEIKERGRDYFNPAKGGSFDAWENRPLDPLLVQYCAVDVRHFFSAYQLLDNFVDYSMAISADRIAKVCHDLSFNEILRSSFVYFIMTKLRVKFNSVVGHHAVKYKGIPSHPPCNLNKIHLTLVLVALELPHKFHIFSLRTVESEYFFVPPPICRVAPRRFYFFWKNNSLTYVEGEMRTFSILVGPLSGGEEVALLHPALSSPTPTLLQLAIPLGRDSKKESQKRDVNHGGHFSHSLISQIAISSPYSNFFLRLILRVRVVSFRLVSISKRIACIIIKFCCGEISIRRVMNGPVRWVDQDRCCYDDDDDDYYYY